jgi:hypothetical protein
MFKFQAAIPERVQGMHATRSCCETNTQARDTDEFRHPHPTEPVKRAPNMGIHHRTHRPGSDVGRLRARSCRDPVSPRKWSICQTTGLFSDSFVVGQPAWAALARPSVLTSVCWQFVAQSSSCFERSMTIRSRYPSGLAVALAAATSSWSSMTFEFPCRKSVYPTRARQSRRVYGWGLCVDVQSGFDGAGTAPVILRLSTPSNRHGEYRARACIIADQCCPRPIGQ